MLEEDSRSTQEPHHSCKNMDECCRATTSKIRAEKCAHQNERACCKRPSTQKSGDRELLTTCSQPKARARQRSKTMLRRDTRKRESYRRQPAHKDHGTQVATTQFENEAQTHTHFTQAACLQNRRTHKLYPSTHEVRVLKRPLLASVVDTSPCRDAEPWNWA